MCSKKQFEGGLSKGYYIIKLQGQKVIWEIVEKFSNYIVPCIVKLNKEYFMKSEAFQKYQSQKYLKVCVFEYRSYQMNQKLYE